MAVKFLSDTVDGLEVRELSGLHAGMIQDIKTDQAAHILAWGCPEFAGQSVEEVKAAIPFRVMLRASRRILELSGMVDPKTPDAPGND